MSLPTPTPRQLRHHAREFYGFVHFTNNTFTDKEWGYGDESTGVFDPAEFDAEQIVDSARLAGMRGLILTCKHHDGFCLWRSAYTDHSVGRSPFRGGKGDVVGELSQACASAGIEFGVYLSPWDRNRADYGSSTYIDYYRSQLRELLTGYGPLFEVWFDGANGGDGFYGGACETRSIDNRTYYDWENTWKIVRELQPDAVMFSDAGPDVRWIGNEAGIAGDPCWYTVHAADTWPGHANTDSLNRGDRDGTTWRIPECDVSIRPGWFYHEHEDDRVRSAGNLVDLYFASVGRGATFLLNLPPDRRGLIPEIDRESLRGFRRHLDGLFARNVATGMIRSQGWEDGVAGREWVVEVDLPAEERVSVIELREDISLGQRITSWALEARDAAGQWRGLVKAQAVGVRRLIRFAPTIGRHFRIRMTETLDEPMVAAVGLYLEPDLADVAVQQVQGVGARVISRSATEIVLDVGEVAMVKAVCYTPGIENRADRYEVSVASEIGAWSAPVAGEFGNIRFNAAPQMVALNARARYVRFCATRFCMGDRLAGNELSVRVC